MALPPNYSPDMIEVSRKELNAARGTANARRGKITVAVTAEAMRTLIAHHIAPHVPAILSKAEEQALDGDKDAREFLFSRAYGKAPQEVRTQGLIEHNHSGTVEIRALALQVAAELKQRKLE